MKLSDDLLIIDGNADDYERYQSILNNDKQLFSSITHCASLDEALAHIEHHSPQCCILEHNFPGGSAKDLILATHRLPANRRFPMMVITDQGHKREAIELMQMGIQDYLLKDDIGSVDLIHAIKNAMRTFSLQQQLKKMAHFDSLTGLINRSLFMNRLEQAVNEAKRYNRSLSLITLDIDFFKQINDTYGHDVGDLILKEVATKIRECVRTTDSVARLGGDEFMVLLPNAASHEGHYVAQKLLKNIPTPIEHNNIVLYVNPSIGLANFPETAADHHELLKQADTALYKAKEQGRSQYVKFSKDYRNEWQRKNALGKAIPGALENSDIKLAYQPIFDTQTGECLSIEALVRWEFDGETVPSNDIITLVNQGPLAIPFHIWLFEHSMAQLVKWKHSQPSLKLALNIPTNLCHNPLISEHLFSAIEKNGIAPTDIILEVTETHLMRHSELTKEVLLGLNKKGIAIAIDDFGTGSSSLEYLAELPCSQLKIDQRFFLNWEDNSKNQKIVEAITALGHQLGLKIVAEGIENEGLAEIAAKIGCDAIQGFWRGTPEYGEPDWKGYIARTQHHPKQQMLL